MKKIFTVPEITDYIQFFSFFCFFKEEEFEEKS